MKSQRMQRAAPHTRSEVGYTSAALNDLCQWSGLTYGD